MTLDVAEIAGLGLLAALCVGLLRTNASLTRRVDALELAAERARRRHTAGQRAEAGEQATTDSATHDDEDEDSLVSLDGTAPDGSPMSVDLRGRDPQLVAFLSTDCEICASLWERLQSGVLAKESPELRSVVVTKSAALEDIERVRQLTATGTVPTVMSTQAWQDYEIPGSPYFLLVGGEPRDVIGEGPASGWADVSAIVGRLARAT